MTTSVTSPRTISIAPARPRYRKRRGRHSRVSHCARSRRDLYEVHRYLGHGAEAADAARYRTKAALARAGEPRNRINVVLDDGRQLELDQIAGVAGRLRFVFERDRVSLRLRSRARLRELGGLGCTATALCGDSPGSCEPLTERREHLDPLAPERGRVPGGEPHGLGLQRLAQDRIHEIGRGPVGRATGRSRSDSCAGQLKTERRPRAVVGARSRRRSAGKIASALPVQESACTSLRPRWPCRSSSSVS
jgi:hypothetical protein